MPLLACALGVSPDVVSAASPGTGVDISVTEGSSFTKRVANIDSCSFSGATIDWGDGTSSAGQFDTGTVPGVKGTHTYARYGTYQGTVTYSTDCTSTGQASFTATVADAPLAAEGRDIATTVGQPATAVVSHFTDANPSDPPSDFTAQIAWGDGSQDAGTVSASPNGGFDVTGTHTYQSPGQTAVNVTIDSVGGSTAASSSTAQSVSEPLVASFSYSPSLPCQGGPLNFEASASGPDVTTYAWRFVDTGTGFVVTRNPTTSPTYISNGFSYIQGSGDWGMLGAEVNVLRPPVAATLTVTDKFGRTASSSQTINFADPNVIAVIKRVWWGWSSLGAWIYYPEPEKPTPCWHASEFKRSLALGDIPKRPATLSSSLKTLAVRVSCPGTKLCGGTLAVRRFGKLTLPRTTAAGKKRRRLRTLGQRAVLIPAGGSLKEKIRLNKRGRRLARHPGKRVTLIWVTYGHLPRTQTVALHRSHH